jgi:phage terminase large subunit
VTRSTQCSGRSTTSPSASASSWWPPTGARASLAAVNEALDEALFTPTEAPRAAYVGPYRNQTKTICWDYLKRFAGVVPGVLFNETELRADFAHNGGRVFLAGADGCDHLCGVHLYMLDLDEPALQRHE